MKKVKVLLILIFVFIVTAILGSEIYAANTMDLNITDIRPYTSKKYTVTTPNGNIHTIFKIMKRNGAGYTYEDALYCLRSGIGFGNTEFAGDLSEVADVTYTESYNLKTDATAVMNYYRNTIGYNITNTEYNAMLWIIDNMYLPEHPDSAQMKARLLEKAEIVNSELTDDDIEFIQQMALWYFANYDDNGGQNSLSLADTYVLSNTTKVDGESLSETKARQIDTLYRYFIDNAKLHVADYGTGNSRDVVPVKPEIQVNSSSKTVTTNNGYVVVGPFNITETSGNVGYDLEILIKDKNGKIIPEKQDETPIIYIVKNPADMTTDISSVEETIGEGDFYLKISSLWSAEFDLTDVNIEANCTYDKMYKTTATLWLAEAEDQPVIKVEKEEILEGKFNLNINKVDEEGNLLPGAAFTIITEDRRVITVTNNGDGTFTTEDIAITTEGQEFIFEIEEITVPGGYTGIVGPFKVKITTKLNTAGTGYIVDEIKFLDSTGAEIPTVPGVTYELIDNTITLKVENKKVKVFDLALRKYITEINGNPDAVSPSKIPDIDTSKLETDTTADYKHRKDPVEVKTGDKVTYTISVYNEGDIEGIVTEIIDYLPEGLEFDPSDNPELIEYKTSYTETELAGKKYAYTYDATTRTIRILPITGTYLFRLDPYDGTTLDTDSLEIICRVTATKGTADRILTNIATMKYKPANVEDESINDRDSSSDPSNLNLPTNTTDWENYKGNPNNKPYLGDTGYFYEGQEDDDDFDKVIIKGVPFDLALRKFITKVNGEEVESRVPEVDTSKLNTIDETTGEKIETATYKHSKEPVVVKQGDIVTYKIRVYNEGDLDGYATEIADYIPEGLGYLLDYKANTDNFWVPVADDTTTTIDLVGTEGLYQTESAIKNLQVSDFNGKTSLSEVKILAGKAKIYSTALEDEIIKAYNPELTSGDIDTTDNWQQSVNGTDGLYYREVEVTCIVLAENTFQGTLRNIAEIQEDKAVDENGDEISTGDRDSTPDNVDTDNYNPPTDNSTYQEDDDDYEPLELRYFDLALRKFITAVNEEEITTRIPEPTVKEDGTIEYVHDKTPIYVANSDVVTYTIRVYNEGTVLGYAMEVSDDIPDGLEFLPDHATNQEYGWKMYDANGEETTNVSEAVEIRTRYLENDLLNPYDPTKEISVVEPLNPDYAEVKVAFKVVEKDITQEDRIIINKAQITEDKAVDEEGNEIDIDDEDSIPDEWNEGEDDQDIEKIYVKEFDLALLKWVTQTIVTVDGNTTVTDTGFTPYDDPEPIAKVVIDKNKLDRTTVKFVYNIIIMNQGEIPGYATEITDYIPEGLEFIPEDNPIWTKVDDNKITTRALEGTLLQPGESATLEVVFTWKKDPDNLGLKTNIAEISEDYNDKGSEDVDSTPDNVEPDGYDEQQEDDDDKALVILELHTGGFVTSYMWLILTVLLIITGGILLIKKYVI